MSQEKNHIDQQIREKLLQAEVSPPASVWGGIQKALANDRKAAIVILYRRVAYAAAVLLIGFLAYYFTLSQRSINPSKNKLSQQVDVDSAAAIKDAVSIAKTEGIEETETPEPILSAQKDIALPSVAKTENKLVSEEKQVLIASQTILEENTPIDVPMHSLELIAHKKPAQHKEITSLYKLAPNSLKLFKVNAYKRITENEEAINLLAENSLKTKHQGWSVGLAFAPTSIERSSGIFTPNSEAYYDMASSEMSVVSEKDLPAYAGGVNLVYQISDRWSFQSGIYYLKQGQRIENFSVLENDINASNSSNSSFGNISFENVVVLDGLASSADLVQLTDDISYTRFDADLLQQFELLEIPFLASYKIINRKAIFSVLAGINSGFLIGNRVYLSDYSEEPIGKTEAINTLIYKSVIGISFEYPLSRKLYFNLSPIFKYQLNNFNKNAIVNEQLKYLEFKTGLNYRF